MTAPPVRSTPRPPASQATAPVAEFRCLFTHDLRRKQKRWQDGYLKFHSFNNRIMVYDTTRNFLGDTYRKDTNALQEGDELTLDKGIMVEVADAMGVTQTDLTPLFEKKSPAKVDTSKPLPRLSVSTASARSTSSQLRHRSLNTLLGTPRGPIGKAITIQSPYEARQGKENEASSATGRAAKRQKTAHVAPPSSPVMTRCGEDSRTTIPLAGATSPRRPSIAPEPMSCEPTIIEILDSEPDHIRSDITEATPPQTSPIIHKFKPHTAGLASTARSHTSRIEVQVPRLPQSKPSVPHLKTKPAATHLITLSSSPPVSATNQLLNASASLKSSQKALQVPPTSSLPPPRDPRAKSLRLATSTKRGILLCQQNAPNPSRHPQVLQIHARSIPKDVSSSRPNLHTRDEESQVKGVELGSSELESIASKQKKTKKRILRQEPIPKQAQAGDLSDESQEIFSNDCEDIELLYGIMDQQILPLEHSTCSGVKSPTAAYLPDPLECDSPISGDIVEKAQCMSRHKVARTASKKKSKSKVSSQEHSIGSHAPVESRQLEQPVTRSTEGVTHLEPPMSPVESAPSTGGFRKRSRKAKIAAHTTSSDSSKKGNTALLPSAPLSVNQTAASTTSSKGRLISKPQTLVQPCHDPIEDDTVKPQNPSPNRSFRRVRSENDAPIPSLSAEWEQKNRPNSHIDNQEAVDGQATSKSSTISRAGGLAALVKKTDPRRKFQRTQSLTIQQGTGGAFDQESIPSPPLDTDVGPWSTEAFDLFDWRPPNREGDGGIGLLLDE